MEKRVKRTQAESPEDAAGEAASPVAGNENIGTCRPFGIGEDAMLLHNQLPTQRDHEKHTDESTDKTQQKNPRNFELKA